MWENYRRGMLFWWGLAVAFALVMLTRYLPPPATAPPAETSALPALGANIDETSLSGISSGAYMAGQFEMAHGKRVVGVGIIAGGPYGCSESVFADAMPGPGTAFLNLGKAVNGCMLDVLGAWGVGDPQTLANKAKARAERGEIDPLASIVSDRVYLFTGSEDRTVVPTIVRRAAEFYRKLGVPEGNIAFVDTIAAGHAFVTETQGGSCARSGEPYLVDCDYDQAGALLKHIYGPLQPPANQPSGQFVEFDQRAFRAGNSSDGLAATGVIYIPQACRTEHGCRVHIAFHGCAQNRQAVGDQFIQGSGFARWADSNKLLVLFPEVATTVSNPQGCWDWWGYTGHDYLTRTAPQIVAVNAMLEALQRQDAHF